MQLDRRTPLYTAQLKIPPAFQVIVWDGTIKTLQAMGARYNVSGYIDIAQGLQLTTIHNKLVNLGDFMVFYMDSNTRSLHEVLSYDQFHRKYNAFVTGGLDEKGIFKPK